VSASARHPQGWAAVPGCVTAPPATTAQSGGQRRRPARPLVARHARRRCSCRPGRSVLACRCPGPQLPPGPGKGGVRRLVPLPRPHQPPALPAANVRARAAADLRRRPARARPGRCDRPEPGGQTPGPGVHRHATAPDGSVPHLGPPASAPGGTASQGTVTPGPWPALGRRPRPAAGSALRWRHGRPGPRRCVQPGHATSTTAAASEAYAACSALARDARPTPFALPVARCRQATCPAADPSRRLGGGQPR